MNDDFEHGEHQNQTALHITQESLLCLFLFLILSLPVFGVEREEGVREANWLEQLRLRTQLDLQGTVIGSR